jgi:lipoprotein-releasing system permease protein
MKLESFIARRIYGHNDGKRYTRSASLIAIFGIAVGLVVMLLSVAIVRGFKHEVAGKVMGFGSQLQVLSITQNANYEVLPVVTNDSMLRVIRNTEGVAHAQLFASKTGLFKTSEDFCGMQFRGVGEDYDTTFLHKYLVEGQLPRFSSTQSSNQVLISEITAKLLNLQVGQRVFAYFYSEGGLRARRFTVSGIYNTHLTDYDRQTCFTDIRTVRRLNNWEADESSGVEMTKDEGVVSADLSRTLNQALGHRPDRSGAQCAVFTTEELAPGLFAWLDVLDVNVAMILLLHDCLWHSHHHARAHPDDRRFVGFGSQRLPHPRHLPPLFLYALGARIVLGQSHRTVALFPSKALFPHCFGCRHLLYRRRPHPRASAGRDWHQCRRNADFHVHHPDFDILYLAQAPGFSHQMGMMHND